MIYECKSDIIMILKDRMPVDGEPNTIAWSMFINYSSPAFGPVLISPMTSLSVSYNAQGIYIA
jgi:hypothetical protein